MSTPSPSDGHLTASSVRPCVTAFFLLFLLLHLLPSSESSSSSSSASSSSSSPFANLLSRGSLVTPDSGSITSEGDVSIPHPPAALTGTKYKVPFEGWTLNDVPPRDDTKSFSETETLLAEAKSPWEDKKQINEDVSMNTNPPRVTTTVSSLEEKVIEIDPIEGVLKEATSAPGNALMENPGMTSDVIEDAVWLEKGGDGNSRRNYKIEPRVPRWSSDGSERKRRRRKRNLHRFSYKKRKKKKGNDKEVSKGLKNISESKAFNKSNHNHGSRNHNITPNNNSMTKCLRCIFVSQRPLRILQNDQQHSTIPRKAVAGLGLSGEGVRSAAMSMDQGGSKQVAPMIKHAPGARVPGKSHRTVKEKSSCKCLKSIRDARRLMGQKRLDMHHQHSPHSLLESPDGQVEDKSFASSPTTSSGSSIPELKRNLIASSNSNPPSSSPPPPLSPPPSTSSWHSTSVASLHSPHSLWHFRRLHLGLRSVPARPSPTLTSLLLSSSSHSLPSLSSLSSSIPHQWVPLPPSSSFTPLPQPATGFSLSSPSSSSSSSSTLPSSLSLPTSSPHHSTLPTTFIEMISPNRDVTHSSPDQSLSSTIYNHDKEVTQLMKDGRRHLSKTTVSLHPAERHLNEIGAKVLAGRYVATLLRLDQGRRELAGKIGRSSDTGKKDLYLLPLLEGKSRARVRDFRSQMAFWTSDKIVELKESNLRDNEKLSETTNKQIAPPDSDMKNNRGKDEFSAKSIQRPDVKIDTEGEKWRLAPPTYLASLKGNKDGDEIDERYFVKRIAKLQPILDKFHRNNRKLSLAKKGYSKKEKIIDEWIEIEQMLQDFGDLDFTNKNYIIIDSKYYSPRRLVFVCNPFSIHELRIGDFCLLDVKERNMFPNVKHVEFQSYPIHKNDEVTQEHKSQNHAFFVFAEISKNSRRRLTCRHVKMNNSLRLRLKCSKCTSDNLDIMLLLDVPNTQDFNVSNSEMNLRKLIMPVAISSLPLQDYKDFAIPIILLQKTGDTNKKPLILIAKKATILPNNTFSSTIKPKIDNLKRCKRSLKVARDPRLQPVTVKDKRLSKIPKQRRMITSKYNRKNVSLSSSISFSQHDKRKLGISKFIFPRKNKGLISKPPKVSFETASGNSISQISTSTLRNRPIILEAHACSQDPNTANEIHFDLLVISAEEEDFSHPSADTTNEQRTNFNHIYKREIDKDVAEMANIKKTQEMKKFLNVRIPRNVGSFNSERYYLSKGRSRRGIWRSKRLSLGYSRNKTHSKEIDKRNAPFASVKTLHLLNNRTRKSRNLNLKRNVDHNALSSGSKVYSSYSGISNYPSLSSTSTASSSFSSSSSSTSPPSSSLVPSHSPLLARNLAMHKYTPSVSTLENYISPVTTVSYINEAKHQNSEYGGSTITQNKSAVNYSEQSQESISPLTTLDDLTHSSEFQGETGMKITDEVTTSGDADVIAKETENQIIRTHSHGNEDVRNMIDYVYTFKNSSSGNKLLYFDSEEHDKMADDFLSLRPYATHSYGDLDENSPPEYKSDNASKFNRKSRFSELEVESVSEKTPSQSLTIVPQFNSITPSSPLSLSIPSSSSSSSITTSSSSSSSSSSLSSSVSLSSTSSSSPSFSSTISKPSSSTTVHKEDFDYHTFFHHHEYQEDERHTKHKDRERLWDFVEYNDTILEVRHKPTKQKVSEQKVSMSNASVSDRMNSDLTYQQSLPRYSRPFSKTQQLQIHKLPWKRGRILRGYKRTKEMNRSYDINVDHKSERTRPHLLNHPSNRELWYGGRVSNKVNGEFLLNSRRSPLSSSRPYFDLLRTQKHHKARSSLPTKDKEMDTNFGPRRLLPKMHHVKVNRSARRTPLKKSQKPVRTDWHSKFRDDSNGRNDPNHSLKSPEEVNTLDVLQTPNSRPRGQLRRIESQEFDPYSWKRSEGDHLVPILGLFDLTARPEQHVGGSSELAAARLALKHINEKGIISGHRLVMVHNDTKCDSGVGVDAFFHAIYTSSARVLILLGAACPEVTESLAAVVHYWNIVQVSFGSVSPALSDRSSFPRFIRTVAPDSSHNAARLALLTHYSWSTVATISENHDMYTLALNELMPALEAANISLQATVTLSPEDYTEHLHTLKEKDCRIIIASFSPDLARKVFCQAFHLGMYGEDYAWVLSGSPQDSWWQVTQETNCSTQQLVQATQGAFLVANHGSIIGENASESGLTNSQFLQEFSQTGQPLTEYVTQTYDAVWTIALALRQLMEGSGNSRRDSRSVSHRRHALRSSISRREVNSAWENRVTKPSRSHGNDVQQCNGDHHQSGNGTHKPTMSWILRRLEKQRRTSMKTSSSSSSSTTSSSSRVPQRPASPPLRRGSTKGGDFILNEFDYSRGDMADRIQETMQRLRFRGVSGPISFDCPDRVGVTAFYQIQDGIPTKVALYHPEEAALDLACPGCMAVVWPGGAVPAARVFKIRVETISPGAFCIMSALASLGILMALAFLIFNLTYRRLKYIKLSSPRLNNTTVVGCILVYMAVILLGLDHATLPSPHYFPVICTARAYLLSAGFSLAFGSMFTKTYRVHQIFTRSNSAGVIRNKLLKDKQLITLIMVLLMLDVLMVSAWVGVDPMTRHLHNLTLETSTEERGVVYQPQVEVCRSAHTSEWLGAFYVYKGLLVAVGVYMAWETRHVKIPALNDSQYIGMSVYNVVITSAIVIVAANIISERTTLAYVIVTTLIITSTTTTLCLLFIPKILTIWRKAEGDPIVESMGLKIQSNTRRLMTEDKKEKYYRAEVQNKVYRRELHKLEQEILKLRKKIESPESPTSSADSSPNQTKDSVRYKGAGRGRSQGDRGATGRRKGESSSYQGKGESSLVNEVFVSSSSSIVGGRALEHVLDASHTQFLRSDDATVRRVKRERLMRSLHRSLPSLTLSCPSRRPSDTRLPADGAEDANGSPGFGPSQVFFDPHRFHEDEAEARRQAEADNDKDDDDDDDDDDDSEVNERRRSSKYGTVPASPHPLQRCRLVKRSPIKPRVESEDEGIVDLRYTLNFSTPLLHGVTEADLPFSISSHVRHGSRVSFREQDSYHFYDSSPEIRKSSLGQCSYSSPEVRRSSMASCSSTDIRLQIEYSDTAPNEKLSPVVEYRVNDLDLLCPYGGPSPHLDVRGGHLRTLESPTLSGGFDASNERRFSDGGHPCRGPLGGDTNHSAMPGHRKSSKRKEKKNNDSSALSNAARSSGHMFSAVIVHHVVNVHI